MSEINYYKFHSQLALPYLETSRDCIEEIFKLLKFKFRLNKNSKFIDLGSGDGRIVIYAAINYGIKAVGIEIDTNLINEARENVKSLQLSKIYKKKLVRKIKFKEADFFRFDLKKYDFIYLYTLPTMHAYLRHVLITAKPNAVIISHRYELNLLKKLLDIESELKHVVGKNIHSTFFYLRNDF